MESDVLSSSEAEIAAGHVGEPEELAALVAFLASKRAAYITGATIQAEVGHAKSLL